MLPAFLVAVVLLSASPGPAMALVLHRATLTGTRATVGTVLGLELGLFLWALAAGAGLAALVAASDLAFTVLRVVGAGVLIVLGVRALRAARRYQNISEPVPAGGRGSSRAAFGEGLLVQLANPKAAVFMFAFYPQFVSPGGHVLAQTVVLASLQVLVETALYLGLAAAVGRASAWFRRPVVRRWLGLTSGGVLVGLGLRVAATSR